MTGIFTHYTPTIEDPINFFIFPQKHIMLSTLKYFITLLVSFYFYAASAQEYQTVLHKPYVEKITTLHRLYANLVSLKDSISVFTEVAKIKQFAQQYRDRELELEMELFSLYYNITYSRIDTARAIHGLRSLIEVSDKENIKHIKIRAIRTFAQYYWEVIKNYELAFEQYLLLDRELGTVDAENYPEMAKDLLKIGEAYYFFRDYIPAKKYFEKIITLTENDINTRFVNSAKNTLGLCYQTEKDLEKSDYYFSSILRTQFPRSKITWEGIAKGNLGENCYLRGDYEKAIPLLEFNSREAEKVSDFGNAAGAQTVLAAIYLEKKDFATSSNYIHRAKDNIQRSSQEGRLRFLYPLMSKWYSANGLPELAKAYLDSTIVAINVYNETFNAHKMIWAQQKIAVKEQNLKLTEMSLEKQQQINQRNTIIVLVVVLCLIVSGFYFMEKRTRLLKDLSLQKTTHSLEIANLNLNSFTQSISEKNRLIEQLQSQQSEQDKTSLISQLQQSTILTDDNWKTFQQLLEQVYPGFINRIKQTYPNISQGEIRYFVLAKLNLSSREMAAVLGVSPNTVQVMRHRIRKKLDFSDNEIMDQNIHAI